MYKSRKGQMSPTVVGVLGVIGIIIILALNPFVVINSGEVGITKTMGKVSQEVRKDGLSLKMPLMQEVITVSTRNKTEEGQAVTYSSDLQTMTVHYKTIFSVPADKVVDLYVKYNGNPYENFVAPRIEEAVKIVGSKYTAEKFVTQREVAKTQIIKLVEEKLNGLVSITDIAITNVDLTDELEQAIEQKQVEQQKAEQKKYELLGAQQGALITTTKAKAEAEAIRVKAIALKQSPQLVELEKVKMMEAKWDGQLPTTMVLDGKGQTLLPLK